MPTRMLWPLLFPLMPEWYARRGGRQRARVVLRHVPCAVGCASARRHPSSRFDGVLKHTLLAHLALSVLKLLLRVVHFLHHLALLVRRHDAVAAAAAPAAADEAGAGDLWPGGRVGRTAEDAVKDLEFGLGG